MKRHAFLIGSCLSTTAAFLLMTAQPCHGASLLFTAQLSGEAEAPPVATPGAGWTAVTYDSIAQTLRVQVEFSDLLAPVTAAHIHAPTAVPGAGTIGVATQVPSFLGFPHGVSAGSYDMTFNLKSSASFNPAFVTNQGGGDPAGAEAALIAALLEGRAYLNIHTTLHPAGEIRGFLTRSVPEPATGLASALAMLLGLAGMEIRRRRS
jgi:hypothetical protein